MPTDAFASLKTHLPPSRKFQEWHQAHTRARCRFFVDRSGPRTGVVRVNLVRPITEKTGPIRAEGRSLYVGRRSGTAEGKIIDASGTLLAHGTTTCMIFAL